MTLITHKFIHRFWSIVTLPLPISPQFFGLSSSLFKYHCVIFYTFHRYINILLKKYMHLLRAQNLYHYIINSIIKK